jgi:hypothetical protein
MPVVAGDDVDARDGASVAVVEEVADQETWT